MHQCQTLSAVLRFSRRLRGISQSEAGAEFGVSERSVRRWESGDMPHPVFRAAVLAAAEQWISEEISRLRDCTLCSPPRQPSGKDPHGHC